MKKTDIIRNQNPKNILPGESYPGMEGDRTQGPGKSLKHAASSAPGPDPKRPLSEDPNLLQDERHGPAYNSDGSKKDLRGADGTPNTPLGTGR